jgi:AcrR family transcriptional regulator
MAKQHRGEIVHEVVLKSGVKVSRLYGALGISRPTLYRRFEDPNLNFEFIQRVGEIIYHNFAEEFKELTPMVAEPVEIYQIASLEECKDRLLRVYDLYLEKARQYDELKARYDALLSERGQ